MMAGTVAMMRERPTATFVLAVFLIVAGLTLCFAREAIAYTFSTSYDRGAYSFPRDSNGQVPEGAGDLNPGPPQPRDWHVYGQTSWYGTLGIYSDKIQYDWPEMNWCNAPENAVRRHERAHSRGWSHGAGSPSSNPAHYPTVSPCNH